MSVLAPLPAGGSSAAGGGKVLWVTSWGTSSVTQYVLSADGRSAAPGIMIRRGVERPLSVRLDGSGNLWVVNGDDTIAEYSRDSLRSDDPGPVSVYASGLSQPVDLAFDSAGRLWTANWNNTITAYHAGPGGRLAHLATLDHGVKRPQALEFDSSGNLWLANYDWLGSVVEYKEDGLLANHAPFLTIDSKTTTGANTGFDPSLGFCSDVAFDPKGALWIANGDASITVFSGEQLDRADVTTPVSHVYLAGFARTGFDGNGHFLTADTTTDQVLVYDVAGVPPGLSHGGYSPIFAIDVNTPTSVVLAEGG